jgi:hypothetical protein
VSFNPGVISFQPGKHFALDITEGGLGEDHGIEESLLACCFYTAGQMHNP